MRVFIKYFSSQANPSVLSVKERIETRRIESLSIARYRTSTIAVTVIGIDSFSIPSHESKFTPALKYLSVFNC
jgi:hypothetical protein